MSAPPNTIATPWVSAETKAKEDDFRGFIRMHTTLCKNLVRRSGLPYLYADLYAGPGWLHRGGDEFEGSPLIAQQAMIDAGLAYESVHYERDPATAAQLVEALSVPRSLTWWPDPDREQVFAEPCQDGFARWLDRAGAQPDRYGLVYADPISDEILHALFNRAARLLPRVDLLSYVAATQYLRRRRGEEVRNGHSDLPFLADHVSAVNKRFALIREPVARNQFTFVLWSNWEGMPEWARRQRGFYRLDSPRGQAILDRLNFTKKERHERDNVPLPSPYSTYREYLRHPKFLAVRAQVFERAGGICERCGVRRATEPHHLTYPPWGMFDVPENLVAVCHQCHCRAHGKER